MTTDHTLANPDTLTKYRTAAGISEKVLEAVKKLCVAGEKIVSICEHGDKLLEEEIGKVYRGKKILKGALDQSPLVLMFILLTQSTRRLLPSDYSLAQLLRHAVHTPYIRCVRSRSHVASWRTRQNPAWRSDRRLRHHYMRDDICEGEGQQR